MSELNYPLPVIGEESLTADPRTLEALQHIKTWGGGSIDSTNLKPEGVETASIKKEAVSEDRLTKAVVELLNAKTSGLAVVKHSASAEAVSGELFIQETTGTTVTLPTPVINRSIGVFYANTSGSITVKCSSGAIAGDALSATECKLLANQHLWMIADGSFWRIMGGEPKREAVWTTGEATEGTPSASRPAEVAIHSQTAKGTGEFKLALSVGGVSVATATTLQVEAFHVALNLGPYRVPPGLTWKATGTNNEAVFYSQLLL